MFDQAPRSDFDFWTLVKNTGVVDGDLPEGVDDLQYEVIDDKENDYNDCYDIIDNDIIELVEQLSDDVASRLPTELSLIHSPLVNLQQIKHASIRKVSSDNYLNVANKKLKHYQNILINKVNKFNLQDCVGVRIHSVDRINIDAKSLLCLVIEKVENDEPVKFKLACQYGKLDNVYSLEHLIDLRMACPDELKHIVVDDLKNITFIEA